jgi:phosphoribosyl 1,2-cyclic phosphodiesterase
MIAYTLFSGSTGNSIFVKNGSDEILIDAGKSATAIEKALLQAGTCLSNIKAIFLTHEHSDHTGGLEIVSKKYHIPIHITAPSYPRVAYQGSFISQFATSHEVLFEVKVGSLTVKSFPVPHDSVQNVGYVITADDGETLGIATDIGHVTNDIKESLCGCKTVIVESNHDKFLLVAGKYPEFLKQRILADTGHLANEDSADLCLFLARAGATNITLAHLSKENNSPEIAHAVTRSHLDKHGYEDVSLNVASPSVITRVI